MAKARQTAVYSKLSVKSQTVLPREVRQRLRVGPGDRLRYVIDADGVHLEKASVREDDDPFATFSEWAGEADEEAYADL
ncbi:MAG: AbrB/MazE/SpoVT family DNA-binding domain-containing protein [Alphaproteobacteria bacterium]